MWEAAGRAVLWSPPSLESEGFIHLSFASQLRGTLDTHYKQAIAAVLLEVDPADLGDALKVEASRGGALFPHVYRPLRRTEFLGSWMVHRGYGEIWTLPTIVPADPSADLPPRSPLD